MLGKRAAQGPLVILLLLVVIVPTAGVVWFMTVAMRNERAAVRETLTAAYQTRLAVQAQQLGAVWAARKESLEAMDPDLLPSEAFAALVSAGDVDSVVIYDEKDALAYPRDPAAPARGAISRSAPWLEAQRLEFGDLDYAAAARAYGRLARATGNLDLAARAYQAQARCLGKDGRSDEAVSILRGTVAEDRFRAARDGQGRLIIPDSLMLALHLLDDPAGDETGAAADDLRERLLDYGEPLMPVAQRRFLMRQLQAIRPHEAVVDALAAGDLALRYLESGGEPRRGEGLTPSSLPNVWQLASRNGTVLALFHEASVVATLPSSGDDPQPESDFRIELVPPEIDLQEEPFLWGLAGNNLQGWRLALQISDQDLIDAAADEEVIGYLWTAALLIVAVVIMVFVIIRLVGRQMRLAKLKNDLIATVTHELKTPLASMRLLVETLLDGGEHDQQQVLEYLELISKENMRLSRLIENFLAFSRMERNRQAFEKTQIEPAEVANAAAEAVSGRFEGDTCRFDIEIAEGLPQVIGDPEALSTAIVNLLDNAYKYSRDDKQILLRTYRENGHVVFAVEDNGIGLSRRAAKRVFERFYQGDKSLSRSGDGVGLGLAIVKFIVDAHEGEVSLVSEPGKGSTFRVKLPAVPDAGPVEQEIA